MSDESPIWGDEVPDPVPNDILALGFDPGGVLDSHEVIDPSGVVFVLQEGEVFVDAATAHRYGREFLDRINGSSLHRDLQGFFQ